MATDVVKGGFVMARAKATPISDSEWDVMEPIWEAGACTAAEVIWKLRTTHDWNHSTIRTLLARLVEQGGARVRSQRTAVRLPASGLAPAMCATEKPLVPGAGLRR